MGKRGPKPKSLVRLAWLLQEDPYASDLELSLKLDVEPESVERYRYRLQNSSEKLTGYCPECFEKNLWRDKDNGERVCRNCGFVVEWEPSKARDLPFDETWQPMSNIAFGKSLGASLSYSNTFRVIAKVHKGENGEQQPIPIRQIRTIVQQKEPRIVMSMLGYGSRLLKRLGLHRDEDQCHLVADCLGRTLRKIGAFLAISKMQIQSYWLVRAAVYIVLLQFGLDDEAEESRRRFKFQENHLQIVREIHKLSRLEEKLQPA